MASQSSQRDLETPRQRARRHAIVSVLDVVGYVRLTARDEEGTHGRWMNIRENVIVPLVSARGGRVIKSTGDGFMLEYPASEDALRASLSIQSAVESLDSQVRGIPPIELRISIHSGSVIEESGELWGDGVNITVRLQEHADPGGVIISGEVWQQCKSIDNLAYADLGRLELKGVEQRVRAFSVAPTKNVDRNIRRLALRAGLPTVVVLPFRTSRGDAEVAFAEALVDEIIGSLAGVEQLFVIARASIIGPAFHSNEAIASARRLGARYALQGRARRTNSHVRVTTELVDLETNRILWTNRYDAVAANLTDVQDAISQQIASTLAPHVRGAELRRSLEKRPDNLEAHELVLQAIYQMFTLEPGTFESARPILDHAIEIDPSLAIAHTQLAQWHMFRVAQGENIDLDVELEAAQRHAAAAIERNTYDAHALTLYGHLRSWAFRDYDAALAYFDRALAASPNSAIAWAYSSPTYSYIGDGPQAISHAQHALRLSPLDPYSYFYRTALTIAHYTNGTFAEAIDIGRRTMAANPRFTANLLYLAACLTAIGQESEAKSVADRVLKVEPSFTISHYTARHPIKDPQRVTELSKQLEAAGLPR